MFFDTQKKLFNESVRRIQNNSNLSELLKQDAFIKFLTLQSILYEEYLLNAQDEKKGNEERLRAFELLKLIESTFNFFENYKKGE